jgi:parallel beta-helix repeat protein
MPDRPPAAFYSYVHADDQNEDGLITGLHRALQSAARLQIGPDFTIFIDRDDIDWGDNWRKRIEGSLDSTSLLIPVITPSFFQSTECRRELERFLDRERELERDDLVWPIYYVSAPQLEDPGDDELARVIASRQYTDWRQLRFEPLTARVVRERLATLAERLRDSTRSSKAAATGATTSDTSSEKPAVSTGPEILVVDPFGRGDHMTIADAVAAAKPGNRVLVRPGLYEESLILDKPVELIGQGAVEDIIITARDADAISFRANIGRISNLTLRQTAEASDEVWYGVDIAQGRLELEACHISSRCGSCVSVQAGADPRVRGNRIHGGADSGIFVYGQALGTFEDNEISRNDMSGVEIKSGSNPTVRRNRIQSNAGPGVLIQEQGLATLEDNDIVENGGAGVEIRSGARGTLRQNRINRNTYEAIWVYENGGGTFEGNDLTDNERGPWDVAEDSEPHVVRSDNVE